MSEKLPFRSYGPDCDNPTKGCCKKSCCVTPKKRKGKSVDSDEEESEEERQQKLPRPQPAMDLHEILGPGGQPMYGIRAFKDTASGTVVTVSKEHGSTKNSLLFTDPRAQATMMAALKPLLSDTTFGASTRPPKGEEAPPARIHGAATDDVQVYRGPAG